MVIIYVGSLILVPTASNNLDLWVWGEKELGSTIEKRVLDNKNLYFWSYEFENAQLGAP